MRSKRSRLGIKNIILDYINTNIKQYTIICIIFLIGLVAGVLFINNVNEDQSNEISSYISNFVSALKNDNAINKLALLKDSLISNVALAVILWFVGMSVVGIPIVYGIIAFRGFCLGYTISSIIATLGSKGRFIFFHFIYITAKHNIYTLFICISCKRNQII